MEETTQDSRFRDQKTDRILKVFDEIKGLGSAHLEFSELRVAFLEKLIVLDGATLALSISAYTTLHPTFVGDGGRGYLLACWKVMLFAISCALLSQALTIAGSSKFNLYTSAQKLKTSLSLIDGDTKDPKIIGMGRDADRAMAWSQPLLKFGTLLYASALTCSAVAFYWLYCFIRANFSKSA